MTSKIISAARPGRVIAGFHRHALIYAAAFLALTAAGSGTLIVNRSHQTSQHPSDTSLAAATDPPNGQFAAYEQDGDIVVALASDGSVVRRTPHHDEPPIPGFSVQGISDDGRYAVAGVDASDPGRLESGHQVVDTVTGADVAIPGASGPNPYAIAVYAMPQGNWLVRLDSDVILTIVSPEAEVIATVTEPFDLTQIGWLRVVPTN
jgi:hypothetical protein